MMADSDSRVRELVDSMVDETVDTPETVRAELDDCERDIVATVAEIDNLRAAISEQRILKRSAKKHLWQLCADRDELIELLARVSPMPDPAGGAS